MPSSTLSPIKQARRAKIIAATEQLFVADGYRATTMEGVALNVGMSKVTVYSYFRDKDALFDAVAATVAEDMQKAFDAALAQDGTVADRIIAALTAKHDVIHDRVRRSSFAKELFAIKDRASAQRFRDLDDGFTTQISDMLVDAGYKRDAADRMSKVLFAASQGIANAAHDRAMMNDQIKMLARLIAAEG